MPLFTAEGFEDGHWAGGLCKELEPNRLREHLRAPGPVSVVPGWRCKARFWHATHELWVQFEPNDLPNGPFFWSGKPAVLPSPEAVYVGYYVERGLRLEQSTQDQQRRGQVMTKDWHWNPFYEILFGEAPQQGDFESIFDSLPAERRCIWVRDSTCKTERTFKLDQLADIEDCIRSIPDTNWIDLVVGVKYTLKECLNLQDEFVNEVVQLKRDGSVSGPLSQAYELYKLVPCSGRAPHG